MKMTACVGFFGKIFGHKFISKIIEYEAPTTDGMTCEGSGRLSDTFESLANKKYKIICKRCGMEVSSK